MSRRTQRRLDPSAPAGRGLPWWLTPPGIIALLGLPTLLIATVVSRQTYRDLWRVDKFLDGQTVWLFLLGLAAFTLAAIVGHGPSQTQSRSIKSTHIREATDALAPTWPNLSDTQLKLLGRAQRICLAITLFGYVIYLGLAIKTAGVGAYTSVLTSGQNFDGALKDLAPSIPGITTLSQAGVITAIISEVLYRATGRKSFRGVVLLLLLLAGFRSFFFNERLATIEVIVPLLTIGAMHRWRTPQTKRTRSLLRIAPILAIPALMLVFGIFEHSRSWVFYKGVTTDSYPTFVGKRLAGYYSTSYNNGALLIDQYNENFTRMPFFTLDAVWNAPVIGSLGAYESITGESGESRWNSILDTQANREFNSPCGLAAPFSDYGTVGGLIFFGLLGWIVGIVWRKFDEGDPLGVLLYPLVVVGVAELPRYGYLTAGRATPAILVGVIVATLLRKAAPKSLGIRSFSRIPGNPVASVIQRERRV
jgi:hypothetical protein